MNEDDEIAEMFETDEVRITAYLDVTGSYKVEVMLRLVAPASKIDSISLRNRADMIDELASTGLDLQVLDGVWAVGERFVPCDKMAETIAEYRIILGV